MGKFQKEGAHSYLDRALALISALSRPHFKTFFSFTAIVYSLHGVGYDCVL